MLVSFSNVLFPVGFRFPGFEEEKGIMRGREASHKWKMRKSRQRDVGKLFLYVCLSSYCSPSPVVLRPGMKVIGWEVKIGKRKVETREGHRLRRMGKMM